MQLQIRKIAYRLFLKKFFQFSENFLNFSISILTQRLIYDCLCVCGSKVTNTCSSQFFEVHAQQCEFVSEHTSHIAVISGDDEKEKRMFGRVD